MSMSDSYAHAVCRQRLAGLCAALGWNATHDSAMEVMVDLLRMYTTRLGKDMKEAAEHCRRSRVTALDADMVIRQGSYGQELHELTEYLAVVKQSGSLNTENVPKFPKEAKTDLNFLKAGSREVLTRKVHINDYFPPMHPELEEEAEKDSSKKQCQEDEEGESGQATDEASGGGGGGGTHSTTGSGASAPTDTNHLPVREISSVMMTPGGFISPAREGKLPESRSLPTHVLKSEPAASPRIKAEAESEDSSATAKSGAQSATKLSVFAKKTGKQQQQRTPKEKKSPATKKDPSPKTTAATNPSACSRNNYDDVIESVIQRGVIEAEQIDSMQQKQQQEQQVLPQQQPLPLTAKTKTPPKPRVTKAAKAKAAAMAAAGAEVNSANATSSSIMGKGRGRKRKKDNQIQALSREYLPSSDSDSSPERKAPTPALPAEEAKSIEEQLASNPLIPKGHSLYGFPSSSLAQSAESAKTGDHERSPSPPPSKRQKEEVPSNEEEERTPDKKEAAERDRDSKDRERDKSKKNKASKKKKDKDRDRSEKLTKKSSKKDKEKRSKRSDGRDSASLPSSPSPAPSTSSIKISSEPKPKEEKVVPKLKIKTDVPKKTIKAPPVEQTLFDPAQAAIVSRTEAHSSASQRKAAASKSSKSQKDNKTASTPAKEKKERATTKRAATASTKKAREKRSTALKVNYAQETESLPPPAPVTIPPAATESGIVTKTVGSYIDDDGNQVWFCPGCGKQDDGIMPMIGCDGCDDWYHWACVGITQDPGETQNWFCGNCMRRSRR